jgi:hypothetical protein
VPAFCLRTVFLREPYSAGGTTGDAASGAP